MIALYILLAVLFLIFFLLFVNIHVIFTYRESARVTVRVLFFRFDGMKLFRSFTKEKDKTKKNAKAEQVQVESKRKKSAERELKQRCCSWPRDGSPARGAQDYRV